MFSSCSRTVPSRPRLRTTARRFGTLGWITAATIAATLGHAKIASAATTITDLGTLGGTSSGATGLNDSGQVVGNALTTNDAQQHAFRYSNGVMTDLGTLGGTYSTATDINTAGEVVGNASTTNDAQRRAFRYSNGVMTDLGTLGGTYSEARAINTSGQVVGYAYTTNDAQQRAFLYSDGVMTDLNSLLPPDSGWLLYNAQFINDNGQIVGRGFYNGQDRAFLLNLNKPTPSVSIGDVIKSEGNSGSTTLLFPVTLSTSSTQSVTVNFATQNGTAIAGGSVPFDYTARVGTLTFLPGQTTRNISVIVRGDLYSEADETFTLNLSNANNATIDDGSATGTITNDDGFGLPTISTQDVPISEGNSGTKSLVFTFTLDKPSETSISFNFATQNGTAISGNTAPADYSARSGSVTFAPNQTSRTVAITIYGDTRVEPNETFSLNLSNASGATLAQSNVTGTITNDD